MTTPAKVSKTNRLHLEMSSYKGLESTLCAGCGHQDGEPLGFQPILETARHGRLILDDEYRFSRHCPRV